ncbi:MAG: sortase B protein-sorting domain-containing protein [Oscillospiraceae bacterium]|nr:sortase B protein-sorting domain-containing protein [Oscillospiraceae bacterium]
MNLLSLMAAAPKTGDERNVILYAVLALAAAALIIIYIILSHKSKKK